MSLGLLLSIPLGGAAGFAYHRFIGCRSGACPLWANPYAATLYGALIGLLFGAGR